MKLGWVSEANKMPRVTHASRTIMANRSFSAASRLTSAASVRYSNTVSRVYDSASRILSETLTVGATPYNIGYEYDADNRQTHVTYPDGSVVARNFTDRNQLDVVTFNNALVANFNYDNAGRKVAANFGNGITETRTYQADNLNTAINTPGVTSFGYTWDANKRKLTQTETGIPLNNQTYSYDDEDRLASFNRNNGDNQTWNLSLVGDWNQFNNNGNVENRTHNAVHEITTVDANPLAHDLKGNLTQNKNGQTYAWDIENRLTTATVPAGCPEGVTGTHTYTYDALGRRVSKTVGGNTTVFVSDGMQEIAEYVNGAFSQSYVYGSYIDEPLAKYTSGTNPPLYYHASNLYSIAALTDNAGNVVERYRYDPYGKATVLAPDGVTVRPNSLYKNDIAWEGRRIDRETNLMYFRQRMYSMDLGIFISRYYKILVDPHFYRFQFNKPTKMSDPMGDPTDIVHIDSDGGGGREDPIYYADSSMTVTRLYNEWKDGSAPLRTIFPSHHPFSEHLLDTMLDTSKYLMWSIQQRCAKDCSLKELFLNVGYRADAVDYMLEAPGNALWVLGLAENKIESFLGSYGATLNITELDCCKGTGHVSMHVWNYTGWASYTRIPIVGYTIYDDTNTGPGRTTRQDFYAFRTIEEITGPHLGQPALCCDCHHNLKIKPAKK
jgi:RHS repeat-associated protein